MDQLNLERLGIPTATVVTSEFISLAQATASAEAEAEMCFVVVPHPMGMIPQADIRKKADGAFSEVLKAAIEWQPPAKPPSGAPGRSTERVELTGSVEDVNKLFFDEGWSLGLPIIPPTLERVKRMLQATSHKPGDVVGRVPPQMGTLTVEMVAVHAAMAGCKPEYMPVLIAALKALLAPEAAWRSALTTTGTTQTIVIVDGPVVQEIGLAYQEGAAGKGHHANATIGYSLNLIGYVIGGSRPPLLDKSTLGSPADFVCWVFGENEARLPSGWKPLHVQRGFQRSDSVVTVMASYPPVDNIDHWSATPQEHLRWWSHAISPLHNVSGPCLPATMEQNPVVALGPEHAELIASAGWTQDDLRRELWDGARIPLSAWPAGCPEMDKLIRNFGPVTPETRIPIVLRPELFLVALAGGAGKHSHYFPPFPGCFPVSRPVAK